MHTTRKAEDKVIARRRIDMTDYARRFFVVLAMALCISLLILAGGMIYQGKEPKKTSISDGRSLEVITYKLNTSHNRSYYV
ncbi:hypothetical protein [Bacillus sp. Hm123]|uniref:hypothetical protein n=1 Tax=Bacillus sp. Hm123 TaxID=3450745 RepID=UPI003F43A1E5